FGYGEGNVGLGWVGLLSASYQRRADVLNRGFSGYNTRHALELVPKLFARAQSDDASMPLFCTLFFGANDSALPGERQHIPRDEFADNLTRIITSIREVSHTKDNNDFPIIIMTPPPVDSETWKRELGLYDYHDRTPENTIEYVNAAKTVAKELECPCLDTWELLDGNDIEKYKDFLSDGLHLSENGNRKVHEGLMALLEKEFPHLAPSRFIDGEYTKEGVQVEEALWSDLC
ncbi:MAG: hypothetical protein SGILL_003500, partial [Bacillariaceae sp.]